MEGYSHPEVTNLFSKVTVSARAVIHQLKQAVQESFIVLFSPLVTKDGKPYDRYKTNSS